MFLIKPKAPVFRSFLTNASCQLSTINGISHFVTSLLRGKYKCQCEIDNNKLSRLFSLKYTSLCLSCSFSFLRILCSKEDSGINKRIYQKAVFKRNFSYKAPHSVMYLLDYPFLRIINLPTLCISRSTIQVHAREIEEVVIPHFFLALPSISKFASFTSYTFVKSLHLHSYHPNVSHFFSYLVYSNTTITSSPAPLWLRNNPFLLLQQLKLSFWIQSGSQACP